jgi:hypothetical protein
MPFPGRARHREPAWDRAPHGSPRRILGTCSAPDDNEAGPAGGRVGVSVGRGAVSDIATPVCITKTTLASVQERARVLRSRRARLGRGPGVSWRTVGPHRASASVESSGRAVATPFHATRHSGRRAVAASSCCCFRRENERVVGRRLGNRCGRYAQVVADDALTTAFVRLRACVPAASTLLDIVLCRCPSGACRDTRSPQD